MLIAKVGCSHCDFIYISIWDADLHDFVNPENAKQC
jgi:serine/threonine-protein kinase